MRQIKFLRVAGISEGVSFLVLLLVAMPLKYYAGYPVAVKVAGWIHGLLFIVYIGAVVAAIRPMKWNLWKLIIALIASLIPCGTFILDRSWRERENSLATESDFSNHQR
jgi:integral membrane protein